MPPNDNTVMMEGVRLIYRNFTGKETDYNQEGVRNFAVLLDEHIALQLAEDGWPVKHQKPRPEDEEGTPLQAFLPVEIKYRDRHGKPVRAPRIVLITSRARNNLREESLEMLDWANIINVDLIVRPYPWGPINGKSGIKAYLQSMYITIEEDPLELKYAEMEQR